MIISNGNNTPSFTESCSYREQLFLIRCAQKGHGGAGAFSGPPKFSRIMSKLKNAGHILKGAAGVWLFFMRFLKGG